MKTYIIPQTLCLKFSADMMKLYGDPSLADDPSAPQRRLPAGNEKLKQ